MQKLIKEVDRLEAIWRDTYTSNKVFEFLLRRIDMFNMRDSASSNGFLLYGDAGVGKTHLARKIAESASARFEEVDGAKLTSADEVRKVWGGQRGKGAVILVVENAETIFAKPGSENAGSGTREAALAWVAEWQKQPASQSGIWVIMTAESDQAIHPNVLREFGGAKIEVSP